MKTSTRHPKLKQPTLAKLWGDRVAARRAKLGLSQSELASRCAVTQQTISKIEHGIVIPLDRLKVVIARELVITPGELFAWPPVDQLDGAA